MHDESLDIAALIAVARKDRAVLGRLLEHYRSFLTFDATRRLSRQTAARHSPEDIVQETLTKALAAFDQFRGETEAAFSAWLLKIHRFTMIDRNRKYAIRDDYKQPREFAATGHNVDSTVLSWIEPANNQTTASQRLIKGENALRLADLLMSLPADQREAVRMRHLEGCTIEEIANRMERSSVAAAGLIKRGLQTLRRRMHEESWML